MVSRSLSCPHCKACFQHCSHHSLVCCVDKNTTLILLTYSIVVNHIKADMVNISHAYIIMVNTIMVYFTLALVSMQKDLLC